MVDERRPIPAFHVKQFLSPPCAGRMTRGFLARSRRTGSDNGDIRQVLRTSAQDVRRSAKDVLILLRHVFGAWRERGYPGAAAELSPATTIEGYVPLHRAVVPGCQTSN